MSDLRHPDPDRMHPPKPRTKLVTRGASLLSRFGINPNDGASDKNMEGVIGFIRAAINNPHILWGRDNSEIVFPQPGIPARRRIKAGSSSESSSSVSSESSSSAPSSSESSQPSSEQSSEKSTAIVPMPWNPGRYGMMYCVECNQVVWLFHIWNIPIRSAKTIIPLDPRWLFVSEPGTLTICGAPAGDLPFPVGAVVEQGKLILTVSKWRWRRPKRVAVQLVSLRKGHAFRDMEDCDEEAFQKNEAFLNMAR